MDCDFVQIVPELRDLFEVIAARWGYWESFLTRIRAYQYPFFKIFCNRGFHLLVRLFLHRVRDISNNLKLYRADILKTIPIDEPHFAANAETGLKPILAGYDIKGVPVSWINRTIDTGSSSFRIVKVAPNYALALLWILWNTRRTRGVLRRRLPVRSKESTPLLNSGRQK